MVEKKRSQLRIHLATAFVAMLSSAVLIGLNLQGKYSLGERFYYGWPWKCIMKHTYDSLWGTIEHIFVDFPRDEVPNRPLMLLDLLVCLGIVIALSYLCERFMRRQESRKEPAP